jgi:tight adherence protein B
MNVAGIEPKPEFAGILKNVETFGAGRPDDPADRLNSWFDALMLQSGVELAPSMVLLLSLCTAIAAGGTAFVVQENFLTTAIGGLAGFLSPIAYIVYRRASRQKQILTQIPPMVEELARAAKTGRSVEHSLQLVADDTPAPLGNELKLVARRLDMGVPLRDALRDLPQRTGVNTLSLLNTTLVVQQQTGGDLVTVLERLSRTVRDRLLFLGRLRAATAASRATAVLMIALPPAVLTFFSFREPDYLRQLTSSAWGRNATLLAVSLEILGALWVLRILKDCQRT